MLPDELGELNGWDSAVYYRPDGQADVGGDFYDAVELSDGRIALFIGDVMGHGITGGRGDGAGTRRDPGVRHGGPRPGTVLARLDAMFEHLHLETLVSVVYGGR